MIIVNKEYVFDMDAWDMAEIYMESILEEYDVESYIEPYEYSFGGYDAVRMEFSIPIIDDVYQRQVYIYFVKDEEAYTVAGFYFEEDLEGIEQVEGMFDTVQIYE